MAEQRYLDGRGPGVARDLRRRHRPLPGLEAPSSSVRCLVFGIGPHVCPGRSLTLMELRVILEELLGRTSWIEPASDRPAVREKPPVGGWARVPVVLH